MTESVTKKLREMLDDGEWHQVLELTITLRFTIPPETAYRSYMRSIQCNNLNEEWCLNKGYRHVVIKALSHLHKSGVVERKWEGQKIVAVRMIQENQHRNLRTAVVPESA